MFKILIVLAVIFSSANILAEIKPALMLANVLQTDSEINLEHYWVSEKYDGVRAYWDGKRLLSRQGHEYHAPKWFIKDFPHIALDGELWLAREQFDRLSGIVRKQQPIDAEWQQVRYMVFDLPHHKGTFDERLLELRSLSYFPANSPAHLTNKLPSHLVVVPQWRIESEAALLDQLAQFVAKKAEGLMLHDGRSYYAAKRSNDLLKLKPSFDREAVVIGYEPGKGKYQGMMGALWVEVLLKNNTGELIKQRFKIGSGFNDKERQNPPEIGSIITFQYSGLTSKGKPRFARYWRLRNDL